MKRIIDYFLLEWKNDIYQRKPLLIRGARQVGKTHSVRKLGKTFKNFAEVNLEADKKARKIFSHDLDPKKIVFQLSQHLNIDITPGETLLFIDEIQAVPRAIIALRYFYELMPELHVVAAGSLLDFAIEQVGVPVGRISFRYMYPMSFLEFLVATGSKMWAELIIKNSHSEIIHERLLNLVATYLAIGGMPDAIKSWLKTGKPRKVKEIHADLLDSYQQDFGKYAKKHQIKYLDLIFHKSLNQLSKKFIFSRVGEYKKRELEPAMELLEKAGLLNKIFHSSGQGIPIGAQANLDIFKIIFLDVGLSQAILNFDLAPWFLEPTNTIVNKGEIVEAFVGQELLAYSDPIRKDELFYWNKEDRGSQAEIDYLFQIKNHIVPIEVKAGSIKQMKSMFMFLESHKDSPYGIRFSTDYYCKHQKIHSYPLYAIAKPLLESNEYMRDAIKYLTTEPKDKNS